MGAMSQGGGGASGAFAPSLILRSQISFDLSQSLYGPGFFSLAPPHPGLGKLLRPPLNSLLPLAKKLFLVYSPNLRILGIL